MRKIKIIAQTLILICMTFLGVSCEHKPKKVANKRPNILFAIMDDATYEHVGAYGCNWVDTPNFDRVAKEGILFTKAYTPNAKCGPSRSSILTGRNSWQLEEAANHWSYFPTKFKTYPEVLAKNNYHVGYTDKGWAPGIAINEDGFPRKLVGKAFNKKKTTPPTSEISTVDYAENFFDFLKSNTEDKPFCFWYGSREPHRRYESGSGIEKGNKKLSQVNKVYSFWPDNDIVRSDLLDYAYEIEYFDAQLGKMLNTLEESGQLQNTIVIVTSDNGMPFPRIKGQEYEYSNHLPLAMMWKNGITSPGRKVDDLISFVDFAPTFLELAHIPISDCGMMPVIGESLVPFFDLSSDKNKISSRKEYVLIGKERHDVGRPNDFGYPIRGIFSKDYLLLRNFAPSRWPAGNPSTGYLNCDGAPTKTLILDLKNQTDTTKYWDLAFGKRPEYEMYNITKDPECVINLADEPTLIKIFDYLKMTMVKELTKQNDPRILGNGQIFDSYTYADSTGVNFYERYRAGEELKAGWVNPSDFRVTDD